MKIIAFSWQGAGAECLPIPLSHGQVTADGAQGAGVQTHSWENDLEGFLPAIKLCGSELWLQPELL